MNPDIFKELPLAWSFPRKREARNGKSSAAALGPRFSRGRRGLLVKAGPMPGGRSSFAAALVPPVFRISPAAG
jgi:hypothetical protein